MAYKITLKENILMIRILEVNPNSNDAMSLYRGRGPLVRLQEKYPKEIEFFPVQIPVKLEWDHLSMFSLVFMLRPDSEHHCHIIKACRFYGIPVWSDFDDLLTDIPIDNPAYSGYVNPEVQKHLQFILQESDYVTFSTQHLAEKMGGKIANRRHVIPNALDTHIFRTPKPLGSKNKIIWRGSKTHERDLYEYRDSIITSLRGTDWTIEFMGMNPIYITDYVRSIYTPYMSKNAYFEYLHNVGAKICVVPLSDRSTEINFNKSKSNIAWIEATYSGCAVLAPDWDEWRKPGVITYKNRGEFREKLTAMISGQIHLEECRAKSWQYICDRLTLNQQNATRYNLIKKYLKR